MEGKRVALYCRVDGGGDAQVCQQALLMQRDGLETYARERGLQIVGYYKDAGYAGCDLTRPGLRQLLADWEEGKFDAVLVAKRTRLFRGGAWEEPKWPFLVISAAPWEEDDRMRKAVRPDLTAVPSSSHSTAFAEL